MNKPVPVMTPILVYEGDVEADFPSRVVLAGASQERTREVIGDVFHTYCVTKALTEAGIEWVLLPEVLLVSDYNGTMEHELVTEVGEDPYKEEG